MNYGKCHTFFSFKGLVAESITWIITKILCLDNKRIANISKDFEQSHKRANQSQINYSSLAILVKILTPLSHRVLMKENKGCCEHQYKNVLGPFCHINGLHKVSISEILN